MQRNGYISRIYTSRVSSRKRIEQRRTRDWFAVFYYYIFFYTNNDLLFKNMYYIAHKTAVLSIATTTATAVADA